MSFRLRRVFAVVFLLGAGSLWLFLSPASYEEIFTSPNPQADNTGQSDDYSAVATTPTDSSAPKATDVLAKLPVKGRAPKTGYARDEFYSSWPTIDGCNLRQRIIRRELGATALLGDDNCTVISGEYDEPYTGVHKIFSERAELTVGVQIDHVVALSDAWQKGAQNLSRESRYALATDPLNLLAVDSSANQTKSDGDAATWLPSNKSFRCQYVARQVSVKYKYSLWVTEAEHDAIAKVLANCPSEPALGLTDF